jgi:cell division protein FtsL
MPADRPARQPVPPPPPRRPHWGWAVASTVAVAAGLIFVAWAKVETVQITYRIAELRTEEQDLANEQRRLRAELAELRSPPRLEALAPDLGLRKPDAGQVFVVTEDPDALKEALHGAAEEPSESTDAAVEPPEPPAEGSL